MQALYWISRPTLELSYLRGLNPMYLKTQTRLHFTSNEALAALSKTPSQETLSRQSLSSKKQLTDKQSPSAEAREDAQTGDLDNASQLQNCLVPDKKYITSFPAHILGFIPIFSFCKFNLHTIFCIITCFILSIHLNLYVGPSNHVSCECVGLQYAQSFAVDHRGWGQTGMETRNIG